VLLARERCRGDGFAAVEAPGAVAHDGALAFGAGARGVFGDAIVQFAIAQIDGDHFANEIGFGRAGFLLEQIKERLGDHEQAFVLELQFVDVPAALGRSSGARLVRDGGGIEIEHGEVWDSR